MSLTTIILAAGFGKRMKSEKPKVLHEIAFKPIVEHVVDLAKNIESSKTVVVVGHGKEKVMDYLKSSEVAFAVQENPQGTGHAVMMAEDHLGSGDVLILCGDTPLLTEETIKSFVETHKSNGYKASLISMKMANPKGYGRIVKDTSGKFVKIVEQKDGSPEELLIDEVNSGIGIFDANALKTSLSQLTNNNNQNEYYLTDVFGILANQGNQVGVFLAENADEFMGINDKMALAEADAIMQKRIIYKHMEKGVIFLRPETSYIGTDVEIEADTVVYPNSILKGQTKIGKNCKVGPGADICESTLSDEVEVAHSTVIQSRIGTDSHIGPYAYLRPGSIIGKHVKIGDFVEVKNSLIGDGTKVSHLTYVGDGEVGENVNLGCGVVFVNYDGKNKNKTVVKSGAFVGCNSNLISPVTVGENAYVAAGSTITEDVPDEALAIARERQVNKTEWSNKYKKNK